MRSPYCVGRPAGTGPSLSLRPNLVTVSMQHIDTRLRISHERNLRKRSRTRYADLGIRRPQVSAGGDSQSTWERTCSLCNAGKRPRAQMLDCEGSSLQLPHFDGDLEKVTRGLNLSLVAPHLGDLDYPWNCASKVCDG